MYNLMEYSNNYSKTSGSLCYEFFTEMKDNAGANIN